MVSEARATRHSDVNGTVNDPAKADAVRMCALRADNERQRALTIEANERALSLAKRCDALEAERAPRSEGWRRFWPFGKRA